MAIDVNTGDILLYRLSSFLDICLSKISLCKYTRYSVVVSKKISDKGDVVYLLADRVFNGFKLRVISNEYKFINLKVLRISSELSKPLRRCFRSELLKKLRIVESKRYFFLLFLSLFKLKRNANSDIYVFGYLNVSEVIDIFKIMGFDIGTFPKHIQTINWLSHHKKFFEVKQHGY
jgi:hypothetical protein